MGSGYEVQVIYPNTEILGCSNIRYLVGLRLTLVQRISMDLGSQNGSRMGSGEVPLRRYISRLEAEPRLIR
jgi:hypothetical protein